VKVLITGATGRVAQPVVEALSRDHDVWATARFSDPDARARLEAAGVRTFAWDMSARASLEGLPRDFTHVMHAGFLNDFNAFDPIISATCDATGRLMEHCRTAEAFLFISSSVVYSRLDSGHLHREEDPLGGTSTPEWGPAYAATKISAEGTVRGVAAALGLPTTIARLSIQYGGDGGVRAGRGGMPGRFYRLIESGRPVPVRPERDDFCSPLHVDDIARQVPLLWGAASLPVRVVNWGGDEAVSARELAGYIAELAGAPVTFNATESAAGMVAIDPALRNSLIGPCLVNWKDGIARIVAGG
jgi:nucleoside-diphosphate-sugar epimerase